MSVKMMSRVWENSKQGGSQLLLLLAIADNANDVGVAWPGQSYLANKIKMSKRSVPRIASKLKNQGYLFINDRGAEGRVSQYIVTLGMDEKEFEMAVNVYLKFDAKQSQNAMVWFNNKGGRQVVPPDTVMSGGDDTAMSGGDDTAMSTKPSITIIEPSFKKTSANADYSHPISFLSLVKIKTMEMTITAWKQGLEDERAERGRNGVIKFIERKISHWALLPRNSFEIAFFDVLRVEYEADGRDPPQKFPCLETKRLFNEAAAFHNGTLEVVIRKAIHQRGKAIKKIVDYINSPNWKDNSNGHGSSGTGTGTGKSEINGSTQGETRADDYLRRNEANIDAWEAKMFG